MKRVLIFGAGRSSSTLVRYLSEKAEKHDWQVVVADISFKNSSIPDGKRITKSVIDVKDQLARDAEVNQASLVISLLPAKMHKIVAQSCVKYFKNLLTASYESNDLKAFESEVEEKGLLFLNEMGLDPGLDHMSAMRLINRIKNQGHELLCFESFTGGLIAPESDNNPWNYKFTWNPHNVVLAGQDGPARFIQHGKYKYIPYNRLFRRTELVEIEGYGLFEGYANRDSLKYIEKYNLEGIPTIYRGTLRRPGFSRACNVFVQLGATDDSFQMKNLENMTCREFINSFLYYHPSDSVETKLYHYMHIDQDSDIPGKLKWLGVFDDTPIGLKKGTPAQVLEHILKQKWQLAPGDKDMVVMWHKFIYRDKTSGKPVKLTASMGYTGEDMEHTAMSATVGLPLALATELILAGKISLTGMFIPTIPALYEPILTELEKHGIVFNEILHKETPVEW